MNPRMTPGAEAPFDEAALRALFEEVDAPPSLARWRERIELSTSTDVDRTTSSAGPVELRPARRVRPWVRAAAAGFAALTVGAGIVGVVAANRHPSPAPPDPTIIETTTTGWPSTTASGPSTTAPTGSATGVSAPPGAPPASGSGPTNGQQPNPQIPPPYPAGTPVPVPLTGWPGADNTGVPPGTNLRIHSGDLRITTPGAVVSDLRVEGAVYVDAPDVTLVRMLVVPPAGNHAGVYQLPQAPRLTIEHSEIGGGGNVRFGIEQQAAGLTVRRCDIHRAESAIGVSGDATIVDSFLHGRQGTEVYTVGNIARVTLRHNTIDGGLDIRDRIGPVTDIAIDDNLLGGGIEAPTGSGSRDVRVTNNQFRGFTGDFDPSTGWNGQAPGNTWTGNVWSRDGTPANP